MFPDHCQEAGGILCNVLVRPYAIYEGRDANGAGRRGRAANDRVS